MKKILAALFLCLAPLTAHAQSAAMVVTTCGTLGLAYDVGSVRSLTQTTGGVLCGPSVLLTSQYPATSTPITGNSAGTTGAVVGTLAASVTKTTYICGFDVSAIGGTAAIGPVTVAGLVGSSMVYQMSSTAAGVTLSRSFSPCIPGSAVNTAITVTTTANGTATAVDVNSWGYQL